MEIIDTIGHDGCACGEYRSDNLIVDASCRKSGSSGEWSDGTVHLLRYKMLKDDGWKELGELGEHVFNFGADGVVLTRLEDE